MAPVIFKCPYCSAYVNKENKLEGMLIHIGRMHKGKLGNKKSQWNQNGNNFTLKGNFILFIKKLNFTNVSNVIMCRSFEKIKKLIHDIHLN